MTLGRILAATAATLVAVAAAGAAALLAIAFGPTLFGAEALIVTSGSMGKAAPVGSVAITRLVDARAVTVGDVISFRHPGAHGTITHRVIGVSANEGRPTFRTKGDVNAVPDLEPVLVSGSVHRVERVVPYAGYIVGFARTPAGVIVFLLWPVAGLLVDRRRRLLRATAPEEPPSADPPPPSGTSREAIVLGAVAGLLVAGAVARIGSRSSRRKRPRLAG